MVALAHDEILLQKYVKILLVVAAYWYALSEHFKVRSL